MKELTAAMSLLLAIATCLAVFAAAQPGSSERPAPAAPAASAVAR